MRNFSFVTVRYVARLARCQPMIFRGNAWALLALAIAGPGLHAAADPTASDRPGQNPNKSAEADANGAKDEILQLSPFEVVADDKGYYSATTMSGTRLNTRLDDLASSITVVTKEQMQDFAMLDLNDVFLYEANTEGTGNFTELRHRPPRQRRRQHR